MPRIKNQIPMKRDDYCKKQLLNNWNKRKKKKILLINSKENEEKLSLNQELFLYTGYLKVSMHTRQRLKYSKKKRRGG